MERKMNLLKQENQLAMTRSIKEGKVRVGAEWEPCSTSSCNQEPGLECVRTAAWSGD